MAPTHDCHQIPAIADARKQATWANEEIYTGRLGRQPVLTRLDRVERVCVLASYVSTSLLIAVIIAAGTFLFKSADQSRHASIKQYAPNLSKN